MAFRGSREYGVHDAYLGARLQAPRAHGHDDCADVKGHLCDHASDHVHNVGHAHGRQRLRDGGAHVHSRAHGDGARVYADDRARARTLVHVDDRARTLVHADDHDHSLAHVRGPHVWAHGCAPSCRHIHKRQTLGQMPQ